MADKKKKQAVYITFIIEDGKFETREDILDDTDEHPSYLLTDYTPTSVKEGFFDSIFNKKRRLIRIMDAKGRTLYDQMDYVNPHTTDAGTLYMKLESTALSRFMSGFAGMKSKADNNNKALFIVIIVLMLGVAFLGSKMMGLW